MNFRFPDKPQTAPKSFLKFINKKDWVSQSKYDGWRMQIYKTTDELILPSGEKLKPGFNFISRVGRPLQTRIEIPNFLLKELNNLDVPNNSVFDSEFVGVRGANKYSVYIFDCLALNNKWLTNVPFIERFQNCINLKLSDNIFLAETREDNFENHFEDLRFNWITNGMRIDLHEGIVLKKKNGLLILNTTSCSDSKVQNKVKYRDIREERF